jgi:O-antigen/teichoic acid export membrane protein
MTTIDPAAPLPPTSRSRAVMVSTASQLGARGLHLALNAISTLALIRYLGPDRYGGFVQVVTVAAIGGLVSDMGLNKLGVREIARDPSSEGDVLGSVLVARLGMGVVAVALTLTVMAVLGADAEVLAAAGVISLLYFTEALLSVVIVFHVRVQQQYEAFVRVVIEAIETTTVLILIAHQASLVELVAAQVAAATIGVALALALARRRLGYLPRPRRSGASGLFREAVPVGLALLLAAVYLKIPSVLLVNLRSSAEAGLYGAAYQPIEYLLLSAAVVINVLLPMLAQSHRSSPERFGQLYQGGSEVMLAGTIPVACLMVVGGPVLVRTAFGAEFAGSAAPLRLLGLALVPMVLSFWLSVVLLSGGHQRITLAYDLLALVVTVALCFALIPSYGAAGAAMVILLSSLVVLGCALAATRHRLGVSLRRARMGAIFVVGALALVVGHSLVTAGVLVAPVLVIVLGAYALALWAFGLLPSPSLLDSHPPIIGTAA